MILWDWIIGISINFTTLLPLLLPLLLLLLCYYYYYYYYCSDDNDNNYNTMDIKQQIIEKMLQLWGDMICISGLAIKGLDSTNRMFVVRVSRDVEMQVRMALSSIIQIKKNKLIIRTLYVAGSSRYHSLSSWLLLPLSS